jgi:RNA polymerase sigma-70 factor (ECF subfamily)
VPSRNTSTGDFGELYDENVWRVYGYIGYRVGRRQDAEDLTQQTFERALTSWHRFDPQRGSAESWLIAIAHNLVIDHFRRERPMAPLEAVGEAAAGITPGLDAHLGLDPALATAIEELDDRQRELLALRFGGELTGSEIAGLTGLSLANVQQILSRTLRQLRARLEPRRQAASSRASGG